MYIYIFLSQGKVNWLFQFLEEAHCLRDSICIFWRKRILSQCSEKTWRVHKLEDEIKGSEKQPYRSQNKKRSNSKAA